MGYNDYYDNPFGSQAHTHIDPVLNTVHMVDNHVYIQVDKFSGQDP